jgi:hypothetical protein
MKKTLSFLFNKSFKMILNRNSFSKVNLSFSLRENKIVFLSVLEFLSLQPFTIANRLVNEPFYELNFTKI